MIGRGTSKRNGRWLWAFCCLSSTFVLLSLLSQLGLNIRNLNDLLINQELSPVFYHGEREGERYIETRRNGLRVMQRSNVTIIGVAKNVGPKLQSVLSQIDQLGSYFAHSRAFFVQGDSTDGTDRTLHQWAAKSASNRTILFRSSSDEKEDSGHFQGKPIPREGRISKARNVALQAIADSSTITDYLIVVDLDILGWDPSGVLDSFGRQDWDVMCAHGILLHGIYRDTYAFRYDGINTNHHWAGKDHEEYNISTSDYKVLRSRLKASQRRAREIMDVSNYQSGWMSSLIAGAAPEVKPLRVKSCFGGLAIYKFDTMKHCRYGYRHTTPPFMLDCEHVLLHECISKDDQAKIYSNFNMKLWYGHSQLSSLSFKKVWSSLAR